MSALGRYTALYLFLLAACDSNKHSQVGDRDARVDAEVPDAGDPGADAGADGHVPVAVDDAGADATVTPPDASIKCSNGDDESESCSDGGIRERTCENQHWGAWSECAPVDACHGETIEQPCGLNNRGKQQRSCVDGTWGTWSACEDPDVCENGNQQDDLSSSCGFNDGGHLRQLCENGKWSSTENCADDDVCKNGKTQRGTTACGEHRVLDQDCVDGRWQNSERCVDMEPCSDGETQRGTTVCGLNNAARIEQTCVGGYWQDTDRCDGDNICKNGDVQPSERVCGPNQNGKFDKLCELGAWTDTENCRDDDICKNSEIQNTGETQGCFNGGTKLNACEAGHWQPHGCSNADVCTNGTVQAGAGSRCGLADSGRYDQVCAQGKWTDGDTCKGALACLVGDTRPGTTACCGPEGAGVLMQECSSKASVHWADTQTCGVAETDPTKVVHGDVALDANADMASMSGVVSVMGNLRIGRDQADAILDLSALSSLRCVQGDLNIDDTVELTDLRGLEQLEQVLGSVEIEAGNRKLSSLNGLNGLKRIGSTLRLYVVHELTTTAGLESLTEVGGHLKLESNPKLEDLSGFSSLRHVGGSLILTSNDLLSDITGLHELEDVGLDMPFDEGEWVKGLAIEGPVQSLHGLEKLRVVVGKVLISGTELETLEGLNLEKILTIDHCATKSQLRPNELAHCEFSPSYVEISYNSKLLSVENMLSVKEFGPQGYEGDIQSNALLPDAQKQMLIQHLKDVMLPTHPVWDHSVW